MEYSMPKIGERTYDVRILERGLHRGEIKKADLEKYLKNLPDDASNTLETRPGDPEWEGSPPQDPLISNPA